MEQGSQPALIYRSVSQEKPAEDFLWLVFSYHKEVGEWRGKLWNWMKFAYDIDDSNGIYYNNGICRVKLGKREQIKLNLKIAASLLSADLRCLEKEIRRAEQAGADWFHFDVMDGYFVPNISFGIPVLECVRRCTALPIDVHFMVTDPLRFIRPFQKAGADRLTFHVESQGDPSQIIKEIHEVGAQAGITLNPDTPLDRIQPYLSQVDQVLVMTVQPGFGGQKFLTNTVGKIQKMEEIRRTNRYQFVLQADGGINRETSRLAREAGADSLVAGSYLFHSKDFQGAVYSLRK